LPWYLRRFANVGYWSDVPDDPQAPVIISSIDYDDVLDKRLDGEYQREYYGLRPEVLLRVYVEDSLWKSYMKTKGSD